MTKLRPITHGPRYHWFGYYDKRQFDPSSRYILGMAVDFDVRTRMTRIGQIFADFGCLSVLIR